MLRQRFTLLCCVFTFLAVLKTHSAYAQDTITICKDVRNIIFTIYTTQGKAVAWQWTLNGGTYSGSLTDSTCGPVKYPQTGIFTANCLVTFSTGNDSLHRFVIRVFDGTVTAPVFRDTTICGNIALPLDAGAANPITKFKWTPGGQTTRQITATAAGTFGVSVYTVDDYSYNCVGCVACDSASSFINITAGIRPVVQLGPDRFICNDNPVTLDAGAGFTSYSWQPGGETSQTITTAISGTYSVTVTNSDGCSATDQIFLKDSCPMYIFLPDAFTPDGNSINDLFRWVGNMKMKNYNLVIYNRWGQKMFESDDPNETWDGHYNGKPCPQGIYSYLLKCVDTREERHVLKGNVTLLL